MSERGGGKSGQAKGRSLHVGVNKVDPAHYNGWDGALNACEFDANDMRAIAESRGFEATTLLTSDATADAVQAAIRDAARDLRAGDFFFVTYSGHGGQVPDKNDEDEDDRSDETWVLYDRQLVDDELYALWSEFAPGVRIFLLSDSCHSGSVAKRIDDPDVPDVVASAEAAAHASPRYRALPRDVMVATYRAHADEYDSIQRSLPSAEQAEVGATVLLISGCQDHQLSLDGFSNGLFTENLRAVWDNGSWADSYRRFHEQIVSRMPANQTPNYLCVGGDNAEFEQQNVLTVA